MSAQNTDLTFFTNDKSQTLLDRFKATLAGTRLFDVLVGYFHASGFYQLCDSLESVEKTRILVGLGSDVEVYHALNVSRQQRDLAFESHAHAKKLFQDGLVEEIEYSLEPDEHIEIGLKKFIRFLQTDCSFSEVDRKSGGNGKKLEIRVFPSQNIHAKVYIGRFVPTHWEYGFVVTGSSNFSYSGLVANREFNVELKQRRDVEFALEQFEILWRDAVDLSSGFVQTIQKKTWLNDAITPYELYLKLIYEYLQEDINMQDNINMFLPVGFMKLRYQEQAAIQALKRLEEYNGVFLADVVGLGKTFIAALMLQQVKGRILVICPPLLKEYWENSLFDFRVPAKVESLGKLDRILRQGTEQYDYIVVDEAHRFRNEGTQAFSDLMDICRGKKVILATATPLNNSIDDIFTQLKLFQAPKMSTIPGIPNLEKFFSQLRNRFSKLEKDDPEYREAIGEVSREIRERILKHVMIRRTRSDVTKYFGDDIKSQGLVFPEIQDPQKIIYVFEGEIERVFNETIQYLQDFRYSRYIPLIYYTGKKKLTEFEKQQQRNVGGFMKNILVKRLESSFFAFKKSISRFVTSYERFIQMFQKGTVYISKKVNVYDLIDNDDIEKLDQFVQEEKAQKYDSGDFSENFLHDLKYDLEILKKIRDLWHGVEDDPKMNQFFIEIEKNKILKKNKLVIFTESMETGDYLYRNLIKKYPGKVMFYCSHGGNHDQPDYSSSHNSSRELIKVNYDPTYKQQSNSLRILITTDVLAEGVNLHRSNTLLNYDLPWNPTRVLQRAGRINRLGSQHNQIFIFNFYPTSQSEAHLGLEDNIKSKIQMFHDILGEDAKYLSDGEEIGSQELFDSLNDKKSYTGEGEDVDSELKYLEIMRELRDERSDLFKKIRELPKKARSGYVDYSIDNNHLVTFFRFGKLKKFYLNHHGLSNEITFFDAVNLLECSPETPRINVPADYFKRLESNKQRFYHETTQESGSEKPLSGQSNLKYVEMRLKDKNFRTYPKFTDMDEAFLDDIRNMIARGTIAKKIAQKLKKDLEKTLDPLEVLQILRNNIRVVESTVNFHNGKPSEREVILSGYVLKK